MQTSELILTILFFLAVTGIFTYFGIKKKKDSWEGVLIKKRKHYDDESLKTTYKLIFKTIDGKKKRHQVRSEKIFNQWQEGDKAIKISGEYFPKKA
jgi:hypothetical protein